MSDGPIASASSRCYQVTHRTVYSYSDAVTSSYGRGFLIPRDSARQRCLSHELIIEPEAADSSTSRDVYGNISSYFHVTERHHSLSITSNSVVEVDPAPPELYGGGSSASAVGDRAAGGPRRGAGHRVHPGPSVAGDHRRVTRLCRTEFRARPTTDRGAARLDVADLQRLHVPVRVDDGIDSGQPGFGGARRGMSGLRQAGHRLPACQRFGGELCLGIPGDRPAAGKGTHGRHRRDTRLGVGVDAAEPMA